MCRTRTRQCVPFQASVCCRMIQDSKRSHPRRTHRSRGCGGPRRTSQTRRPRRRFANQTQFFRSAHRFGFDVRDVRRNNDRDPENECGKTVKERAGTGGRKGRRAPIRKSTKRTLFRKVNALQPEILRLPRAAPPSEAKAHHEACRGNEPPEDDRRKNQIQPDAHERAKHSTFLSIVGATGNPCRP